MKLVLGIVLLAFTRFFEVDFQTRPVAFILVGLVAVAGLLSLLSAITNDEVVLKY